MAYTRYTHWIKAALAKFKWEDKPRFVSGYVYRLERLRSKVLGMISDESFNRNALSGFRVEASYFGHIPDDAVLEDIPAKSFEPMKCSYIDVPIADVFQQIKLFFDEFDKVRLGNGGTKAGKEHFQLYATALNVVGLAHSKLSRWVEPNWEVLFGSFSRRSSAPESVKEEDERFLKYLDGPLSACAHSTQRKYRWLEHNIAVSENVS